MTAWRDGPETSEVAARARVLGACDACVAEDARRTTWPDPGERTSVTSPDAAADLLVPGLLERDRERCVALLLDTKHRLIRQVTVSVGSVDHTFVNPREVYRDALLANASALVLGHNHPSGDPEPSRDDELVTRRVASAGQVVGVELLDHLVVGAGRWVSLARRGCL
ncbi:MAG TPA: DNA repair protein RadC [Nitriliruptorales bacterium]